MEERYYFGYLTKAFT